MTTAPAMPAFAETVNAVVIRSSVWLGIRPIFNDLLGTIDKQIAPEAMTEWKRIEAVAAELGLNEEEVA